MSDSPCRAERPATPNVDYIRRLCDTFSEARLRTCEDSPERRLILRRYAQLRRHPTTKDWTDRRFHALVVEEARSRYPGVKVAVSTLRLWIKKYNATDDGGLDGLDRVSRAATQPELKRGSAIRMPI